MVVPLTVPPLKFVAVVAVAAFPEHVPAVVAVVAVKAFPVHDPELPVTFPVTFPVNAPVKVAAATEPFAPVPTVTVGAAPFPEIKRA